MNKCPLCSDTGIYSIIDGKGGWRTVSCSCKKETRLTPRALDRGDSAVEAELSTPEGYTGKAADTHPAPGK